MFHGLEARSPFLDHQLVEFVAGLPGNLKLRGWKKKYILKEAMKDILPAQVLKRKKRGFDVPVSRWLKNELREVCQDIFSSSGLITEILQRNKLEEMFEDHVADRKDKTGQQKGREKGDHNRRLAGQHLAFGDDADHHPQ